jgi:hypothetical protein
MTRVIRKPNRRPLALLQPIAKNLGPLEVRWMTSDLSEASFNLHANEVSGESLALTKEQRHSRACKIRSGIVKAECDWLLPSADDDVSTTAVDHQHNNDDDDDDDVDVDDDYDAMWRPW